VTSVSYEVTATVFRSAAFVRLPTGRYRMRYEAGDLADVDRYFKTHATQVRGQVPTRFPAGITLERDVGEVLGTWER
jgi:hypothetical protein